MKIEIVIGLNRCSKHFLSHRENSFRMKIEIRVVYQNIKEPIQVAE